MTSLLDALLRRWGPASARVPDPTPEPPLLEGAALERARDHAVASLVWAFGLAVTRKPNVTELRGMLLGHGIVVGISHHRVGLSVELDAVVPEGVWVHARTPADDQVARAIGHDAFDAHYRVSPPDRAQRLAPELVELLARTPRPGLALTSRLLAIEHPQPVDALVQPSEPASRDRFGVLEPKLVVWVRDSVALAHGLDACGGRRWG